MGAAGKREIGIAGPEERRQEGDLQRAAGDRWAAHRSAPCQASYTGSNIVLMTYLL